MKTLVRNIVAMLYQGKMQRTKTPLKYPDKVNFVICCDYGDWSGFRTYKECENQYKELENYGKQDGYYWVEER